jgi:hypothetical protein
MCCAFAFYLAGSVSFPLSRSLCACACAYAEQGGCCAWLRATARYLMRGAGRGEVRDGRTGARGKGQMAWAWLG